MAELDRSVVLAFLNFKREDDGYIVAIHGGGELHHLVTGDAYSCFWLSVSDQPLSDDMEATPLSLDRVGVVRGVLSATKRAVPTIDVSFDPENGMCFFTAYLTAPVCIPIDPGGRCPTVAGLRGLLWSAAKARAGKRGEYHPDRVHKFWRAAKSLCNQYRAAPRLIPNDGTSPAVVVIEQEPRLFGVLMPMSYESNPTLAVIKRLAGIAATSARLSEVRDGKDSDVRKGEGDA